METEPSEFQTLSETLKCQTWVLKICIDCEGCSKKVKRVLQAMEGVYTAKIDAQQHKVTVTGNVSAEVLIKKLAKSGKRAELLRDNIQKIHENPKKGKKQDKKNVDDHQDGDKKEGEDKSAEKPKNAFEDGRIGTPEVGQKELPVVATDTSGEVHETSEKKKKKKKGEDKSAGKPKYAFEDGRNGTAEASQKEMPVVAIDASGEVNETSENKKKKKKKKASTGDNVATDGCLGIRFPLPEAAASVPVLPAPPVDLSRTNFPICPNPAVYNCVPPELGVSYNRATYAAPAESCYATPVHTVSCAHPVVTIPQYDPFVAMDNGNDDDDYYYSCSIM